MVGADITPGSDHVINGYFCANPDEFAFGSLYNPEVFVKVYMATNGWCNMAFNHVSVDPVSIYTAHNDSESLSQTGNLTLSNRLLEHRYTGVAIDRYGPSNGRERAAESGAEGYNLISGLWSKAVFNRLPAP